MVGVVSFVLGVGRVFVGWSFFVGVEGRLGVGGRRKRERLC